MRKSVHRIEEKHLGVYSLVMRHCYCAHRNLEYASSSFRNPSGREMYRGWGSTYPKVPERHLDHQLADQAQAELRLSMA